MSEIAPPSATQLLKPITSEDFEEWQRDVNAQFACPLCGVELWHLLSGPDVPFGALPGMVPDGTTDDRHMRLIVSVCSNCGFVRLHAHGAYERWRQAKEIEKEGS